MTAHCYFISESPCTNCEYVESRIYCISSGDKIAEELKIGDFLPWLGPAIVGSWKTFVGSRCSKCETSLEISLCFNGLRLVDAQGINAKGLTECCAFWNYGGNILIYASKKNVEFMSKCLHDINSEIYIPIYCKTDLPNNYGNYIYGFRFIVSENLFRVRIAYDILEFSGSKDEMHEIVGNLMYDVVAKKVGKYTANYDVKDARNTYIPKIRIRLIGHD